MIIALNNKSNLDKDEFLEYQEQLKKIKSDNKIILCPTNLNISNFNIDGIELGSQNVSSRLDGAYTGEVSAKQLKSYKVNYSIVGHSERREYQLESNKRINKKIKRLLDEDITPILCVGENELERKNNSYLEVIGNEIKEALADISEEEKTKVIIAYEPIWSIGTGMIPNNEEITEVFKYIKELVHTKVLYGGSANNNNIEILKEIKLIDGFLLGGLSLKPNELQIFINKLNK